MLNHVILKKKGKEIPMSFLEKSLAPNPDGWGFAVADGKELMIRAFPVDKNSFKQVCAVVNEGFRDFNVLVQFTKTSAKQKGVNNFGPFLAYEGPAQRIAISGSGLLKGFDDAEDLNTGLNVFNRDMVKPILSSLAATNKPEELLTHKTLAGLMRAQVDKYGCFVCMDKSGYYVFVGGTDAKTRDYDFGLSSRDLGEFKAREQEPEANKPPVDKIIRSDPRQQNLNLPKVKVLGNEPKSSFAGAMTKENPISKQMKEAVNVVPLANSDLIPDEEVEKVMDMSIKYTDAHGTPIPSMNTIKELTKNTPDFKEQTSVGVYDTLFWSDEDLRDVMQQCPKAFFEMCLAMRRELLIRYLEDGDPLAASETVRERKVA